jgi:hypothetical protein
MNGVPHNCKIHSKIRVDEHIPRSGRVAHGTSLHSFCSEIVVEVLRGFSDNLKGTLNGVSCTPIIFLSFPVFDLQRTHAHRSLPPRCRGGTASDYDS